MRDFQQVCGVGCDKLQSSGLVRLVKPASDAWLSWTFRLPDVPRISLQENIAVAAVAVELIAPLLEYLPKAEAGMAVGDKTNARP